MASVNGSGIASGTVVVVLEIGNSILRGGIAGEPAPRFVLPFDSETSSKSGIGYKYPKCSTAAATERLQYQRVLEVIAKLFSVYFPYKPKDCAVVVIESVFEVRSFRDALFSVLMKDIQVAAVSFQLDIVMPLLAFSARTAVIVDIGNSETRCLSFHHGRPLLNTLIAGPIGISKCISHFANGMSSHLSIPVDNRAAGKLFETLARHSSLPSNINTFDKGADALFSIPDSVIFASVDMLIEGDQECVGIAELVLKCVKLAPIDARLNILSNIIVCGGGASIRGIDSGLCMSVDHLCRSDSRFSCFRSTVDACIGSKCIRSVFDPSNLAWIGGSIFGSINRNSCFVSQSELVKYQRADVSAEETQLVIASQSGVHRHPSVATLSAPDWMSLDQRDWSFFSPIPYRKLK